jgi:hypothetical protein
LEEGLIDDQEYSQLKKDLLEGSNQESSKPDQNREREEGHPNKSYCPHCGSSSIESKTDTHTKTEQEKQINWGRAVAGWALFGPVGGAVGGLTGKQQYSTTIQSSNTSSYCLNCGTSWDPQNLYKLRESIKDLTGFEANLAKENHRIYVDNFINEMNPLFEQLKRLEFNKKTKREKDEEEFEKLIKFGCSGPIVTFSLVLAAIIGISIQTLFDLGDFIVFLIILSLIFIFSVVIGVSRYNLNAQKEEKAKIRQREENKKEKEKLKEQIKQEALDFHHNNLHLTE